jgi:hypothetical integral membrane protein (TIGR02206 family)
MTTDALPDPSAANYSLSVITAVFQTFGSQHLVTLTIIIALCFFLFQAAKSRTPAARKWLGRFLGFVLLSHSACVYLQQAFAHALSLEYSLPLELCSLVLIACVVSLFWPNRLTSEIAYFWGLGGVVQATITPDLAMGFPSWDFALFFWGHGATLLAIVFLVSDREFKPRRNSIARMMAALNIYALAVGSINAAAGWNYGYLCRKPSMPSLFDWLGPWPWYLLSLELIAFLTFLILDRFWRVLVWMRGAERAPANPPTN